MSYATELVDMARALVEVARLGQEDLPENELPVALLARNSVLELLTVVHSDVTGIRLRLVTTDITGVEAHPVAALGTVLGRHPRPVLEFSPTDALAVPVVSQAGQAWLQTARHALLAQHHWTTGEGPPLDAVMRWTGGSLRWRRSRGSSQCWTSSSPTS